MVILCCGSLPHFIVARALLELMKLWAWIYKLARLAVGFWRVGLAAGVACLQLASGLGPLGLASELKQFTKIDSKKIK